jgi:DNA-binding IscR family transcriptional regulator
LLLNPGAIHLHRVVEAVQGPLRFLRCPRRGKGCPLNPDCPIYQVGNQVESRFNAELERIHIADLLHGPCELGGLPGSDALR